MKNAKSKKAKDKYLKITSRIKKAVEVYFVLLISVFPLFLFRNYINLTKIKFLTFTVITIPFFLFAAFWSIGMFLDKKGAKRSHTLNIPMLLFCGFIAVAVISHLLSPYKGYTNSLGLSAFFYGSGRYNGLFLVLLYLAVFWMFSRFFEYKKYYLPLLTAVMLALSIITVIQYAGFNFLHFYPEFSGVTVFVSTLGNLGVFTAVFSVFIPIVSGAFILLDFGKKQKILLLLSLFFSFSAFFLCDVSSGKVALALTALLFAVILPKDKKSTLKVLAVFLTASLSLAVTKAAKHNNRGFLLFLLCGAVFAVLMLLLSRFFKDFTVKPIFRICILTGFVLGAAAVLIYAYFKCGDASAQGKINMTLLEEISGILHGRANDTSGSYRLGVWKYSLKMAKENLLFGTGIGSFKNAFSKFTNNLFYDMKAGVFDVAHNEYIQILCTTGIVGMIIYTGFFVSLFAKLKNHLESPLYLTVLFGVIAYLVQAFFNFSIVISAPFFVAALGILNSVCRMDKTA